MSHFTTIRTKMVSKAHLISALTDVSPEFGLGPVRQNVQVRGYSGNQTAADLVVGTRSTGYDLGFRMAGGNFEMVADWYGIKGIDQAQLTGRLDQRYAYHAVREQFGVKGFTLVEETVEEDRSIRLVVRRAV